MNTSPLPVRDPGPIWKSAETAIINGDLATLERLLPENEQLFREEQPSSFGSHGLRPDYSGGDARSILLRNHHFESWDSFSHYLHALHDSKSPVAQFEAAADAIVNGDLDALERLLLENSMLVRARSVRRHRATLLHYVGSNGVEYFRQKCPRNIVAITRTLLHAGAEIDALAQMYGADTTLGLAATSIHPARAGVLLPLLETLLDAGAAIDSAVGDSPVVNACLRNGRPEAAEFLANRGARLDLEGAAGVGRLDLVESFFQEDGTLQTNATHAQMLDGFSWACEYGRTSVVEFLLDKGIDPGSKAPPHGQTGLHWAAYAGHVAVVMLLLQRNAPVETEDDRFHGSPLGWAVHAWRNLPAGSADRSYAAVVALLTNAGATVHPEWLADETVLANPAMLAALSARS